MSLYGNNGIGKLKSIDITIANGATTSSEVNLGGLTLVGISFPAALTGTAVSFTTATSKGGTFNPMYNASGAMSYTAAANRYVAVNPDDFLGAQYLKVVSNGTEDAARTLTLHVRGL